MTATNNIIALLCTPDGRIVEVIRDDFGMSTDFTDGASLSDYFPHNIPRIESLLHNTLIQDLYFDPDFLVRDHKSEQTYCLAGIAFHSYLCVIGGQGSDVVRSYYQKIVDYLEVQTAVLRDTLQDKVNETAPQEQTETQLLDEVSRLNNDLVNTQRRLSKKNIELEKALAQVRKLEGLIPICAGCKKIRDSDGYWQEVEQYIQSHTHAQFSHGLCDDCKIKLYPEFFKENPKN